ncbi:D-2-hydroxyacid dehydrogenase [Ancylobacter sp. 6x-1]|uniref:D-2-hydroxyacid dehydrogenase n=1 Tax=Ancylobacter crimeensis TaxID=2579147 RepID=A0ABT0D7L8_9HYPH|nr:D-2-hydroxyacid dehydrogenase [Ancylobacter crimeensis]MCK0195946.1 D-2-hydroxyacid dehydrogenase [Ancylobacter crimeensis]
MRRIHVHIKNTPWNTAEAAEIFTISPERFAEGLAQHPDLAPFVETSFSLGEEDWPAALGDAEALVGWDVRVEAAAQAAPKLRLIHVIGAGVEHLMPMDWLPPQTTVVNSKGIHATRAGEFGLMAILMLHSHMPGLIEQQKRRAWASLYASPIAGRTLLVIGVGSIGGAVARRAKLLDIRVIGVSRHGRPAEGVDLMLTPDRLDEVLPEADFVFVATPATGETRDLLDRRRLSLMKPGAGLVNVGRAPVVDYDALTDLLHSGHIGGAILDVFEPEPLPPSSPLWSVPNLIVTPHVSADDGASYARLTIDLFLRNLRRHLAGEPLLNVVRPELGY